MGFWLPFRLIGYLPSQDLEIVFDLLISAVAAANLYLHFSKPEKNFRKWQSWLSLGVLFDVICLLPLSLMALIIYHQTVTGLLLFNLLAARHVRHIRSFLDYFDNLHSVAYRLIPIFVGMPLLLHLIACGWIALGSGTAGTNPDPVFEYVRSIYWAFSTLTTVGYGDISAKTIPQMIFTCAVELTGVGVFGFIVSNVASLLARQDAAREHHMDNLDRVETYMRSHHIPLETRRRVRSYYHYLWRHKKGYHDTSVVDELPKKIQSELFFHINKPVLAKVPFLRDANPDLVEELMHELKPHVCVPGEKIFKSGDSGDAMYFIYKGEVEIINANSSVIATLQEGAFFGEMALLEDRKRTATAKATKFCELYILPKAAFLKACDKYPEFLDHVYEVMQERVL